MIFDKLITMDEDVPKKSAVLFNFLKSYSEYSTVLFLDDLLKQCDLVKYYFLMNIIDYY